MPRRYPSNNSYFKNDDNNDTLHCVSRSVELNSLSKLSLSITLVFNRMHEYSIHKSKHPFHVYTALPRLVNS